MLFLRQILLLKRTFLKSPFLVSHNTLFIAKASLYRNFVHHLLIWALRRVISKNNIQKILAEKPSKILYFVFKNVLTSTYSVGIMSLLSKDKAKDQETEELHYGKISIKTEWERRVLR